MAINITIDRWVNEPTTNHANDKVLIYYTIHGSGVFRYVNSLTLFAEEGDLLWTPMLADRQDLRHTPEPITVSSTMSAVFVWDAARQGVMIRTAAQKHLFAITMRDIECNRNTRSGNRIPPRIPPTILQPPTKRRFPFVPPPGGGNPPGGRNPINPGGPGTGRPGGGGRTQGPLFPRTRGGGNTPPTGGGPTGPATPPTRSRPTPPPSNPTTPAGTRTEPSGNRGPVTGTGIYRDPTLRINNAVINPGIIEPDGGPAGGIGTVVNTPVGPLSIQGGSEYLEVTGDSTPTAIPTISNPWGGPLGRTSIGLNAIGNYGIDLEQLSLRNSNDLINQYNSGMLPDLPNNIRRGDPDPYHKQTNILQDFAGIEQNPNFDDLSINPQVLGFEPNIIIDAMFSKIVPKPELRKDPFYSEWAETVAISEPKILSRNDNLVLSAALTNVHSSVPMETALRLALVNPIGDWFEVNSTDYTIINPDFTSSIGYSLNARSFGMSGIWKAVCLAYDKREKVVDFAIDKFVVYPSDSTFGADNALINQLGITEYILQSDIKNLNRDVPDYAIYELNYNTRAKQRIHNTSVPTSLYFSDFTTKYGIMSVSGANFAATIHNPDMNEFICKLYGPGVPSTNNLLKTHRGSVTEKVSRDVSVFIEGESVRFPSVSVDKNVGGIPYRTDLSANTYVLAISPTKIPSVANVFLGHNQASFIAPSSTYTRSGSTWTVTLTLPFGSESYYYADIGKDASKLPHTISWTLAKTNTFGMVTFSVISSAGSYIQIVRLGYDGTIKPSRDTVMRFILV